MRDLTAADREYIAEKIRAQKLLWEHPSSRTTSRDVIEYAARLVERYDPERPCRWAYSCVTRGRCPFDPNCDN